jgi:hypothetical protein
LFSDYYLKTYFKKNLKNERELKKRKKRNAKRKRRRRGIWI